MSGNKRSYHEGVYDYSVFPPPVLRRFGIHNQDKEFDNRWKNRPIWSERALELEKLPIEVYKMCDDMEWLSFVSEPGGNINCSMVREFYSIISSRKSARGEFTWRGARVELTPEWVNNFYHLSNTDPSDEYFYDLRPNEGFYNIIAREMGDKRSTTTSPNLRVQPRWDEKMVNLWYSFVGCRLECSTDEFNPSRTAMILMHAILTKSNINVGKYIVSTLDNSWAWSDDEPLYYPCLITALGRRFHVPEFETDILKDPNAPLSFDDLPDGSCFKHENATPFTPPTLQEANYTSFQRDIYMSLESQRAWLEILRREQLVIRRILDENVVPDPILYSRVSNRAFRYPPWTSPSAPTPDDLAGIEDDLGI